MPPMPNELLANLTIISAATAVSMDTTQIRANDVNFFCPSQTRFSQDSRTCRSEAQAYPCNKSHTLYDLNKAIGHRPKKKKRPVNSKQPVAGNFKFGSAGTTKTTSFPVDGQTNHDPGAFSSDLADHEFLSSLNTETPAVLSVQEGVSPVHTDTTLTIGAPAVAIPSSAERSGTTTHFAGRSHQSNIPENLGNSIDVEDTIIPPGSQIISTTSLHHQNIISQSANTAFTPRTPSTVSNTVTNAIASSNGNAGILSGRSSTFSNTFNNAVPTTTVAISNETPFTVDTTEISGFTVTDAPRIETSPFTITPNNRISNSFNDNSKSVSISQRSQQNEQVSISNFTPLPQKNQHLNNVQTNFVTTESSALKNSNIPVTVNTLSNSHTLEAARATAANGVSSTGNRALISTFASRARQAFSQSSNDGLQSISSQVTSNNRISTTNKSGVNIHTTANVQQFVTTEAAPSLVQYFTPPPTALPATPKIASQLQIPGFSAGVVRTQVPNRNTATFDNQKLPILTSPEPGLIDDEEYQSTTATELSLENNIPDTQTRHTLNSDQTGNTRKPVQNSHSNLKPISQSTQTNSFSNQITIPSNNQHHSKNNVRQSVSRGSSRSQISTTQPSIIRVSNPTPTRVPNLHQTQRNSEFGHGNQQWKNPTTNVANKVAFKSQVDSESNNHAQGSFPSSGTVTTSESNRFTEHSSFGSSETKLSTEHSSEESSQIVHSDSVSRGSLKRVSSTPPTTTSTKTPVRTITRNRGSKKFKPSAYLLQTAGLLTPGSVRSIQSTPRSRTQATRSRTISQNSTPTNTHSLEVSSRELSTTGTSDENSKIKNEFNIVTTEVPVEQVHSPPNTREKAFESHRNTNLLSGNLQPSINTNRASNRGPRVFQNSITTPTPTTTTETPQFTGITRQQKVTTVQPNRIELTTKAEILRLPEKDSPNNERKVIKKKIIVNGRPGSRVNPEQRAISTTTTTTTPKTTTSDQAVKHQRALDALARFSPGVANANLLAFRIIPNKPKQTSEPSSNTQATTTGRQRSNSRKPNITTTSTPSTPTPTPRTRFRGNTQRFSRPPSSTSLPSSLRPVSPSTTASPLQATSRRGRHRFFHDEKDNKTSEDTSSQNDSSSSETAKPQRGNTKFRNTSNSRRRVLKKITPISGIVSEEEKSSEATSNSQNSPPRPQLSNSTPTPEKPSGRLRVVGTSIESSVSTKNDARDADKQTSPRTPATSTSPFNSRTRTKSTSTRSKSTQTTAIKVTTHEPLTDLELEALSALTQLESPGRLAVPADEDLACLKVCFLFILDKSQKWAAFESDTNLS
ncbi:hypothetical protein SK128_016216 [Halocaridina rubra]|uniref:Uncharacterized protein n=1 Tax=Halocaridina rubra TaxID=373956 RepID=A0AAN8WIV9_HALRR